MTNIEILQAFVSGEMPFEEFKEIYFSNQSLQDFLQEKLPKSMLEVKFADFSKGINSVLQKKSWDTKFGKLGIHCIIKMWLKENSIDFTSTEVYHDEYSFLIKVMPDCVHGDKAEALVDNIIQGVPEAIGKAKRIKEIKGKIKDAFHLNDGKKPRWPQDTDWPFSKSGKPLKYVSQKSDGDLVMLTFTDVDIGETVVVEDYY